MSSLSDLFSYHSCNCACVHLLTYTFELQIVLFILCVCVGGGGALLKKTLGLAPWMFLQIAVTQC